MSRLNANSFDDPAWKTTWQGAEDYAGGNYSLAIENLTRALKSFTKSTPVAAIAETYIFRGAAFACIGEPQQAIDDFTEALIRDPRHDQACYNRGLTHQELGQFALAIGDFSNAIALRPAHIGSCICRGICRKRLNDIVGARSDFAEARRLIHAEKRRD